MCIRDRVDRLDAHTVKMNGSFIHNLVVDNEYIRKIRASYYLLGALLGDVYKRQVLIFWSKTSPAIRKTDTV